jgi:hypothetical protein
MVGELPIQPIMPSDGGFAIVLKVGAPTSTAQLARSGAGLLTSDPAAHHRAKQKIVEVVHQTIQAQQSGNLRPVADFVQEDMHNYFSWRHHEDRILQLVLLRDIQLLGREFFDKFL